MYSFRKEKKNYTEIWHPFYACNLVAASRPGRDRFYGIRAFRVHLLKTTIRDPLQQQDSSITFLSYLVCLIVLYVPILFLSFLNLDCLVGWQKAEEMDLQELSTSIQTPTLRDWPINGD